MPHNDSNLGRSGLDLSRPGPGIGTAAPVTISREPQIPVPSQAQPSRSQFEDDPIGAISFGLREVGAALQGQPLPSVERRKLQAQQEAEGRRAERDAGRFALQVNAQLKADIDGLNDEQAAPIIAQYTKNFGQAAGGIDFAELVPQLRALTIDPKVLTTLVGDPDIADAILAITNGDREEVLKLAADGGFVKQALASIDARNGPGFLAKLDEVLGMIQDPAQQTAGLEQFVSGLPRDDTGKLIITEANIGQLNEFLPEPITPAEFSFFERNPEELAQRDIVLGTTAAKRQEDRPLEQIAAEGEARRQTPAQAAAVVTAQEEARERVRPDGTTQRRITKSADGFYRYDDQTRVFPNVEKSDDQGSRRYQNLGAYVDKDSGKFVGEVTFDTHTKKRTIVMDGVEQSVPSSVIPITESDLHLNAMSANNFFKLATEIEDTERGLRELTRFMDDAKDTGQGFRLLADQFLGHMNTIFGDELTEEQFKTFASTGRLQGLLGAYRKEVIGGGVMTEKDALRVIARLGGDFNLIRNKDVAAVLIRELMEEKLSRYNNLLLPQFNGQLTTGDRRGFTAKEKIEVDESVFSAKEPAAPPLPSGFEIDQ